MSIGELKRKLEDFDDDQKVFIREGSAVEAHEAFRMSGNHEGSIILLTLEQVKELSVD